MPSNHEMLVRRHGVKAGLCANHLAIERRHPQLELLDDSLHIRFMNLAVDTFRHAHYIATVNGRFDSTRWPVYCRETVSRITSLGILTEKHRKPLRQKRRHSSGRLNPSHHLSRY